jgi:ABC-type branched-subunit amino acid transport system substrate-binding protein
MPPASPASSPFEVVYKEDAPQWGSAANITVDFKDAEVLGFLGTIDGDATHVALRAALKIETYMINTSDPDPTLTETQIPWLTRVWPDDRQQCFRLANLVVKTRGCQRIAVLRESSRPGRVGVMHFNNYIRRLGVPPVQHLNFRPGDNDISPFRLDAIRASNPDAVLLYGQPEDVGRCASQLARAAGVKAQFFGFDRLKEEGFLKTAGAARRGHDHHLLLQPRPHRPAVGRFRWPLRKALRAPPRRLCRLRLRRRTPHDRSRPNTPDPNRYRVRDYLAALDEYGTASPAT